MTRPLHRSRAIGPRLALQAFPVLTLRSALALKPTNLEASRWRRGRKRHKRDRTTDGHRVGVIAKRTRPLSAPETTPGQHSPSCANCPQRGASVTRLDACVHHGLAQTPLIRAQPCPTANSGLELPENDGYLLQGIGRNPEEIQKSRSCRAPFVCASPAHSLIRTGNDNRLRQVRCAPVFSINKRTNDPLNRRA